MAVWSTRILSPELKIHLAATSRGLCRLSLNKTNAEFLAELAKSLPSAQWWRDDEHPLLLQTAGQLRAWFRGELRWFDTPLDLRGTTFQKRVWRALRKIPYGETRS